MLPCFCFIVLYNLIYTSLIPLKAFPIPGRVCSVGHQSADQQFMAVLSSNVERSIAILIHTINFPTWWKARKREWIKHPLERREKTTLSHRSVRQQRHGYHFGWGSESVWSVREWLPCAGGSSLLCSEEQKIKSYYFISSVAQRPQKFTN